MKKSHGLNTEESEKLAVLYRATGIHNRYSVIPDFGKSHGFEFFPEFGTSDPHPSTKSRNKRYQTEAIKLAMNAARDTKVNLSEVTHLMSVSCTGMYAPGLDIDLVNQLKLNPAVERTAVNFMGCYGAMVGLKLASHICNSKPNAKVLLICTELCTIHFQNEPTEDNLLANALFGDGAAAVIVQKTPMEGLNIKLDEFKSTILPDSSSEMAWNIGDLGFEMKLSSYVPEVLNNNLRKTLEAANIKFEGIEWLATHPGGKKILKVVEDQLGFSKKQNQVSHEVLKEYGNMSSPTVLFVLKTLMDQVIPKEKNRLLALAFGPGITLEALNGEFIWNE